MGRGGGGGSERDEEMCEGCNVLLHSISPLADWLLLCSTGGIDGKGKRETDKPDREDYTEGDVECVQVQIITKIILPIFVSIFGSMLCSGMVKIILRIVVGKLF